MPKKVSVNILNTNERYYLERALPLILSQNYPNFEVMVIDNSSSDGSVEYIKKNFPQVSILKNDKNLGYAGGHNRGISQTDGEYILLLNSDIFLLPNFIEEKVKALEFAPNVGMAEGKLLQISPDEKSFPEKSIIDSTGIGINKMRRNNDRGHGEEDIGQYDSEEFIFGPSGATPLYRRDMLEDISIEEEYFDSTFFIYREEVDLAWRAQLLGWKCRYNPKAVAYHIRGYSPRTRKSTSKHLRRLQFRNRYLMILKNDSIVNLFLHSPYWLSYEILQALYVVLKEQYLIKAYFQFFQRCPEAFRKRKVIAAKKRVADPYIRHLIY